MVTDQARAVVFAARFCYQSFLKQVIIVWNRRPGQSGTLGLRPFKVTHAVSLRHGYEGQRFEPPWLCRAILPQVTNQRGVAMKHSPGFLKLVNDAKSRIREVTVEETKERLTANPNAKLIDVREDTEWEESHAAGAEHLSKGIIERDIEAQVPDKTTELILYCGGGYRSALAADVLQRMGYTNVYSMAGGWKAWKEAGAPVE